MKSNTGTDCVGLALQQEVTECGFHSYNSVISLLEQSYLLLLQGGRPCKGNSEEDK